MKITAFAAAAAIVATAIVPSLAAPAAAQHGPRHGWHSRKVCRVEVHHGHRTRVCRTVRYR